MRTLFSRILREPLSGFLLLGLALVLFDANTAQPDRREAVRVPGSRVAKAQLSLIKQLGREPTHEELQAQLQGWIDEELLYRAARDLGLGEADPIIRRRLTQKMTLLLEQRAPTDEPTDAQLQGLLEAEPARYAHPQRTSFEHRYYSRDLHGAKALSLAQTSLQTVQQSATSAQQEADHFFAGRGFSALNGAEIRKVFGRKFAEALDTLAVGQWTGPINSGFGAHLIWINERRPAQAATLTEVHDTLRADWQQRAREQTRASALTELRHRTPVEFESRP